MKRRMKDENHPLVFCPSRRAGPTLKEDPPSPAPSPRASGPLHLKLADSNTPRTTLPSIKRAKKTFWAVMKTGFIEENI
jgi:hypothetical protein